MEVIANTSRTLSKSTMASSKVAMERSDGELKYLGFVRMIGIKTLMCVLNLYEYAKQKSGPLKSTLQTVENTVTAASGPVYEKYKGVPDVAVSFLDKKVDKAVSDLDKLAPPLAKSVVRTTKQVVYKAADISQEMVHEVRVAGPCSAILYFVTLCKNFVEGFMPILLVQVNRLPVINSVAKEFIPTATVWVSKYNNLVAKLGARGYHFFRYLPLVPVDDIAKASKSDRIN